MLYLLDTNAISDLMRGETPIERWLWSLPETSLVITSPIVRGEILYGILRTPGGKKQSALEAEAIRYFQLIPCEVLPQPVGDQYAALKFIRQTSGRSMDENDLWIAATALALGATLVTRDTDFNGIEGLAVLAIR